MIGVRGSGCSMPITDATANASDIVSGKVAYGNNGRIVGTHTESKITDATASAKDIVSGKVAYNNYGRVTGTLDTSSMMKTYTITIPASTYNWTGEPSTITSASGSIFLDFPMDPFTTQYRGTDTFYNDIYVWSDEHSELLQRAVILNHTNLSSLNITDILGLKWPSVHDSTELETFLKFSYPSDFLHFRIDLQNKRYISNDYETTTNPYVDALISKNDIYIYVDSNSTSFVTSVTTSRTQVLTLYYR